MSELGATWGQIPSPAPQDESGSFLGVLRIRAGEKKK